MKTRATTTDDLTRLENFFSMHGPVPRIFGILNLTDDSFSDGGRFLKTEDALVHAEAMLLEGAAAIDIGAESTRPGALPQDEAVEIARIVPVVSALRERHPDCILSIDTRKASVAAAALDAGADIINDVSGFEFDPKMAGTIASYDAGAVLMHMRGTPETMKNAENLVYTEVAKDVAAYLDSRIEAALNAGIAKSNLILDPGIGFAKTPEQDLTLIRRAETFRKFGCPLFYGVSRKSFIGNVLSENDPLKRGAGTLGVLACLTWKKVDFVRVHEVKEAHDAMTMFAACAGREIKENFCL